MGLIAIGILVLAAALATVLIRRRSASPKPAPLPKRPRFAAVELVAGSNSCGAAKQLAGDRILAADAPMLPLAECTTRCRCSYRRYDDRRDINRRRGDDGLPEDFIYAGSEGRSQQERRS